MFKRVLLGMIAVSALALLWTEASAQTCTQYRNVAGSKTCVRWTAGSEICNVQIQGLTSADFDSNSEGLNGEVTCQVNGTGAGGGIKGTLLCAPDGPASLAAAANSAADTECKHRFNGVGFGHTDSNGHGHDGDCTSVTTNDGFGGILTSLTETRSGNEIECNAKGVCKVTIEIDPTPAQLAALDLFCPGGQHPVTFTASEFNSAVDVCMFSEDGCGQIDEFCTLSGNKYRCVPFSPPPPD